MSNEFSYICPNCSGECFVAESLTGQNVACPHCANEFFATPPERQPGDLSQGTTPTKLPFFKYGRRKLLKQELDRLVIDGELDKNDKAELSRRAFELGLTKEDLEKIQAQKFFEEFEPIDRRIQGSCRMSDSDVAAIEQLKQKYGIDLKLSNDYEFFRATYLLEEKRLLPPPLSTGLMLDANETAYYLLRTTWHQTRGKSQGYSGTSVTVPTGFKGVRVSIIDEGMTTVSDGELCITSKRVLFHGQRKSTSITLGRIVDCQVFSDALRIEKSSGKPDYFRMDLKTACYLGALIGALK